MSHTVQRDNGLRRSLMKSVSQSAGGAISARSISHDLTACDSPLFLHLGEVNLALVLVSQQQDLFLQFA
jgi:hypothetical protein